MKKALPDDDEHEEVRQRKAVRNMKTTILMFMASLVLLAVSWTLFGVFNNVVISQDNVRWRPIFHVNLLGQKSKGTSSEDLVIIDQQRIISF
jgi:hypothetical protein